MQDREPTIRSKELGDALRAVMERAGLTGLQVARRMGCSQSSVSRLLTGKRGGSERDVIRFASVCGVKTKELNELLSLVHERDRSGWLQRHGANVPTDVRLLVSHETEAVEITTAQSVLVPGLLQTPDYARAVISSGANVAAEDVEARVRARLARQQLLNRRWPPNCVFYLHEFVFRMQIGGLAVMSDQIHQVLRMAVRPKIAIRIVPVSVGQHAAMSGSFVLLDVAKFKKVVYLDSETSSLFLEDPVEINAYDNVVAALDEVALDERQSREWLSRQAATSSDREALQDVT